MITILHFVDYSMSIPQLAVVCKAHVKIRKACRRYICQFISNVLYPSMKKQIKELRIKKVQSWRLYLLTKTIKLQNVRPAKKTESNPNVFMPEFYIVHNQNTTHSYSDSHTKTIAYLDLQVYSLTLHIVTRLPSIQFRSLHYTSKRHFKSIMCINSDSKSVYQAC